MSAELEKVIVNADGGGAEEIFPDGTEFCLDCRLGRLDIEVGRGTRWRRKTQAVGLVAGGPRKAVEGDDVTRNHVLGQPGTEIRLQFGRSGRIVWRKHIADQARVKIVVLPQHDDGICDERVLSEDGFDFATFDAHAAYLVLLVTPSKIADVAIGKI